MAWEAMPDDDRSYASKMLEDALATIKELDKAIRGNGGAGLAEQVRNHTERLDRIEGHVKKNGDTIQKHFSVKGETRWKVLGEIAVALVAVTSFLMSYFRG